jgi:hypothetical protein
MHIIFILIKRHKKTAVSADTAVFCITPRGKSYAEKLATANSQLTNAQNASK